VLESWVHRWVECPAVDGAHKSSVRRRSRASVQYGWPVPDKRHARQYADDVVRARQSGDVNSERRAFANLATACRELGLSVDTLLADAEYRARAQVPPHH
jgi:hypothetical protein